MYDTIQVLKLRWGGQEAETGNNKGGKNEKKLVIRFDWAVTVLIGDHYSL